MRLLGEQTSLCGEPSACLFVFQFPFVFVFVLGVYGNHFMNIFKHDFASVFVSGLVSVNTSVIVYCRQAVLLIG